MNKKKIILSKLAMNKNDGVVVVPLKKWQKMEKEKFEIGEALKAIISGEIELKEGRTISSREFLKKYAENK